MEIIPKPKKKVITLEDLFLYFSAFVFIFAVIAYFYFAWAESTTKRAIAELEQKITNLKTPEREEAEKEVLRYQKKIADFSNLIREYIFCSKIFPHVEESVHKDVYLSRMDINFENSEMTILVNAPNFYTLGQQLAIFKNTPYFVPQLKEIGMSGEGKVSSNIILKFDKKILK